MLYRHMTEFQTNAWVPVLQSIVDAYLLRPHRSLGGMSPYDAAAPINHSHVLSCHNKHYRKIALMRKKPKYEIGTVVRLKNLGKLQHKFTRGYHRKFSWERFVIYKISTTMPIPMYFLESLDTKKDPITKQHVREKIHGGFYAEMLQPINPDTPHKINILRTRVGRNGQTEYFVSYYGYGPEHNEWRTARQLATFGNDLHLRAGGGGQGGRGGGRQQQPQPQQQLPADLDEAEGRRRRRRTQ